MNLKTKQIFADIASGDLLQPCSASTPAPAPTPETPCANCTTTDGRRCQFPFFIDGKEYNSCTLDFTAEGTTTPWCATRVDGMGNWLSRQENSLNTSSDNFFFFAQAGQRCPWILQL